MTELIASHPELNEELSHYIDTKEMLRELPPPVVVQLHYLLSPMFGIPIILTFPLNSLLPSFLSVILIFIFIAQRDIRTIRSPLIVASLVGLAASLSWFILGWGHTVNHTHLNSIVLYIPFMLLFPIVLGQVIFNSRRVQ